jgi:hypothetical protein
MVADAMRVGNQLGESLLQARAASGLQEHLARRLTTLEGAVRLGHLS